TWRIATTRRCLLMAETWWPRTPHSPRRAMPRGRRSVPPGPGERGRRRPVVVVLGVRRVAVGEQEPPAVAAGARVVPAGATPPAVLTPGRSRTEPVPAARRAPWSTPIPGR